MEGSAERQTEKLGLQKHIEEAVDLDQLPRRDRRRTELQQEALRRNMALASDELLLLGTGDDMELLAQR